MSGASDIPADVSVKAEGLALQYVEWLSLPSLDNDAEHVLAETIARAIMAERERCATIAEHVSNNFMADPGDTTIERATRAAQAVTAQQIATAINGGFPALHEAIRKATP